MGNLDSGVQQLERRRNVREGFSLNNKGGILVESSLAKIMFFEKKAAFIYLNLILG